MHIISLRTLWLSRMRGAWAGVCHSMAACLTRSIWKLFATDHFNPHGNGQPRQSRIAALCFRRQEHMYFACGKQRYDGTHRYMGTCARNTVSCNCETIRHASAVDGEQQIHMLAPTAHPSPTTDNMVLELDSFEAMLMFCWRHGGEISCINNAAICVNVKAFASCWWTINLPRERSNAR